MRCWLPWERKCWYYWLWSGHTRCSSICLQFYDVSSTLSNPRKFISPYTAWCRYSVSRLSACSIRHIFPSSSFSQDWHLHGVLRTQTWIGDWSFTVAGPRLCNSLSTSLHHTDSDAVLCEFKRLIKTYLLLIRPCTRDFVYKFTYLRLWVYCRGVVCTQCAQLMMSTWWQCLLCLVNWESRCHTVSVGCMLLKCIQPTFGLYTVHTRITSSE